MKRLEKLGVDWNLIRKIREIRGKSILDSGSNIGFRVQGRGVPSGISKHLSRDVLPLASTTLDFGRFRVMARKSLNIMLALPSAGGAATRTRKIGPACASYSQPMISLWRAFGVVRTRSFKVADYQSMSWR